MKSTWIVGFKWYYMVIYLDTEETADDGKWCTQMFVSTDSEPDSFVTEPWLPELCFSSTSTLKMHHIIGSVSFESAFR